MALFELVPAIQVQRSPSYRETLPDGSGYGDLYSYDLKRPERTLTFTARGLTLEECEAWETEVQTRGNTTDVDASNGETYTGKLLSASYETIEGTGLYEITLTLREA